jgi:hypothetical protein
MGRGAANFPTVQPDRAGVGHQGAGQHIEDRALAGPIRSDQPENFTLIKIEIHVVDGCEATEVLG